MVKKSQNRSTTGGRVGVVSVGQAGLNEITALLRRQGVGLSLAFPVERKGDPDALLNPLLTGLRTCQEDAATEIILFLAPPLPPAVEQRVLEQVRRSEKPTVVCLLGADPRHLWRAGAIPAARLDEAALRAVAWVRGWDQALISSQLEDLDEAMEAQARDVHSRLAPTRHRLYGLFTSEIFYHEARSILGRLAVPDSHLSLHLLPSPTERLTHLGQALTDPQAAVILLDIVLGRETNPAQDVIAALSPRQDNVAVIAYVSGQEEQRTAQEDILRRAGIIVAPSSAAAAYIAGRLATR